MDREKPQRCTSTTAAITTAALGWPGPSIGGSQFLKVLRSLMLAKSIKSLAANDKTPVLR